MKPMPKPVKIVFAPEPTASPEADALAFSASEAMALDSSEAPALRTSAQAVPSGYFRIPCC
jgi:hypothetical protein